MLITSLKTQSPFNKHLTKNQSNDYKKLSTVETHETIINIDHVAWSLQEIPKLTKAQLLLIIKIINCAGCNYLAVNNEIY